MKGNFDANVLWPLDKMVQNWIVDRSTARDFTVIAATLAQMTICSIVIISILFHEDSSKTEFI